jgi:hypothetical protein
MRSRTFRPQLEQLDERLVPSTLSSAISIPRTASLNGSLFHWTDRYWYSVDQSMTLVHAFKNSSYYDFSGPPGPQRIFALSASIDPNSGAPECFALAYSNSLYYSNWGELWLWDSSGGWNSLGFNGPSGLTAISATHDGHVYAVTWEGGGHVYYVNSYGSGIDLGAPNPGVLLYAGNSIAASVGRSGDNEVFAIGANHAIYVNSSNTKGDWRLVDNNQFASLSATQNNTVFALTSGLAGGGGGLLYQETEQYNFQTKSFYWTSQYIGGDRYYTSISADTDTYGRDEVYGIDVHADAYLYNQGSWTLKDSDVYDIAAADGGYFYDVDYAWGNYYGYQWSPSAGWQYLGAGLN